MANYFDMNSLQGKITSAYITLVVSTAVLGIIAVSDLLFLERQVTEGEVVSDLKDAVLEMRREEKNLFLYGNTETLDRADAYAQESLGIIHRHLDTLAAIMPESDPLLLGTTLDIYRRRLAEWNTGLPAMQAELQSEIRLLGHQVYLAIEGLSKQERRMLEQAVRESQWFLLGSLFVIGLSIYIVGRHLKRVVVRPIKQLESSLVPLARGKFNRIDPPSGDREFVTFTNAFNRMLKDLEINQKRLLQADKLASLGILAAGVAHELNNPLSNISSSCQLLMEELNEAEPEQLNKWLQQIDSETGRGQRIVRTLLDFGSKRVFHREKIRLLDIIKETRIIIGKTLKQSGVELAVNVPDDLYLYVDKQRMQQLMINIIQNALHAGGDGISCRISAVLCGHGQSLIPADAEMAGDLRCISDDDHSFVEILISDDGPGIPAESLPRVFDPFFTTSEPGHGVGLGLYIVQEIVSEHGGCIAITSTPGKGTKVIILLPVEEPGNE